MQNILSYYMSCAFIFQNVTSSPQYSTFLEHIIPRFLTFLQDGEVQFLQEKPTQVCVLRHSFVLLPTLIRYLSVFSKSSSRCLNVVESDLLNAHKDEFFDLEYCPLFQQLRKLVLEIIHRIPTNEHLRPHTKNILSVMFRFLEV